jgi:hypothetical protein
MADIRHREKGYYRLIYQTKILHGVPTKITARIACGRASGKARGETWEKNVIFSFCQFIRHIGIFEQ